jgi:hypothetical protein
MQDLEKFIKELSPELQQEVYDFAQFLMNKKNKKKVKSFTFSWAGAMKDLRDQYTSVELQHKISEWRIGPK